MMLDPLCMRGLRCARGPVQSVRRNAVVYRPGASAREPCDAAPRRRGVARLPSLSHAIDASISHELIAFWTRRRPSVAGESARTLPVCVVDLSVAERGSAGRRSGKQRPDVMKQNDFNGQSCRSPPRLQLCCINTAAMRSSSSSCNSSSCGT